jgi:hypothetical protein
MGFSFDEYSLLEVGISKTLVLSVTVICTPDLLLYKEFSHS